jgi:hypothetical protein
VHASSTDCTAPLHLALLGPGMAQQAGGQRGKPSILAQYGCAFDSSAAIIGTNCIL